ncbi:hypothetical protein FN846DRAFT_1018455 [Sphaerosporella brunnea]|uniref:Uncharacterized protein n=1 Tax=Sphaerosporella brunnea TaxID=1250544 RepID=A0A5J5FAV5_9PEZI|nr:hypothetical protein FN846DRAFT_1018455 [Sphaerosporella brunnea]
MAIIVRALTAIHAPSLGAYACSRMLQSFRGIPQNDKPKTMAEATFSSFSDQFARKLETSDLHNSSPTFSKFPFLQRNHAPRLAYSTLDFPGPRSWPNGSLCLARDRANLKQCGNYP